MFAQLKKHGDWQLFALHCSNISRTANPCSTFQKYAEVSILLNQFQNSSPQGAAVAAPVAE